MNHIFLYADCLIKYFKVYIYCAGEYGVEMYHLLRENNIKVEKIGDMDESKHGYFINGTSCISYNEIMMVDKNKSLIIVAKKNPESLIEQFKKNGFKHVVDYLQIKSVLKKTIVKTMPISYYEGIKNQLQSEIYGRFWGSEIGDDKFVKKIIKDHRERMHEGIAD